ncbi:MAG TPA: hypothetical protein VFU01_19565 [Gemmatimonadaceae bacterium]|nr:hypothetical protein [Gemmatimonadaceae bacterium]
MILRPSRWLVAAIIADGIVLGVLIGFGFGILPTDGEGPYLVLLGVFTFALYAGVASWLWREPSPRTWGLAMGLYYVGVMIAGGWLALLALGLGMSSTLGGDDVRAFGGAIGLVVAQLVLAVAAFRAAGRAGVQARLERTVTGVISLSVVSCAGMFASLPVGLAVEGLGLARGYRSWRALQGAVHRVQACAAEYANDHPDGDYPLTLAAMGPGGQNCLDARSAAGRDKHGVKISYVATYDELSRVPTFVVTAQARAYGERETVSGDTAGLAMHDGRARGGSFAMFSKMRNCLALYRVSYPERPFPGSIVKLAKVMKRRGRRDQRVPAPLYGGCYLGDDPTPEEERVDELQNTNDGHRFSYRANGPHDYVLEARPITYGETAVRSYLMRYGGDVHVTVLDRPATDDDPVVRPCEYDWGENCFFFPGPPPVIAFVHDTVVNRQLPYTLAARDPRDSTSLPDPSLQFEFDCHAAGSLSNSRVTGVSPAPETSCRPLEDRGYRLKHGKIAVRVWVVDRTGAISVFQDSVRVLEELAQAAR